MLTYLRSQRAALQAERDGLQAQLDGIVQGAEQRSDSNLTPDETSRFDQTLAALRSKDGELEAMDARIADVEASESRAAAAAGARRESGEDEGAERRTSSTTTTPPEVYRRNGENSYFRDLVAVSLQRSGSREAFDRLTRSMAAEGAEQRALSTTDGAGGDFVPPAWMVQDYVELARTARPTADRVRNETLPGGTDQVNVPRIVTGTAVAEQATQNTAVQNTDATTGSVAANVATLAGQQVVALQLIEQSPINLDNILLADLAADYAAKVDLFVLTNNATNKWGLLSQAGTNAATYTTATPTVAGFYSQLANAIQLVTTNRFMPPDTIVMHPRRWAWLLAASDAQNRPLIQIGAGSPVQNQPGTASVVAGANGVVGNLAGLDVVVDPQIPINLGAGTNEDRVIVMRSSDHILWEGATNSEAFRETKADQLSVLLRFYRYAAFTAGRYAKSTSVVAGTGLVAPTF